MSGSDTEVNPNVSPPTSPCASPRTSPRNASPPTSPLCSPPTSPHCSPPTSPGLGAQESPPSSPPTSPLKRKRRPEGKQIHRTTAKRRNDREDELGDCESDESGMEEDCVATTSSYRPEAHDDALDVGNVGSPAQASDGSTAGSDSGESGGSTSSSEEVNSEEANENGSSTEDGYSSAEYFSDSDDEGAQLLCEGSAKTLNEAVLDVLKLYVSQKWTKTGFDKCVKVIKGLLPEPNEFPSSLKGILNIMEGRTGTWEEEVYFFL